MSANKYASAIHTELSKKPVSAKAEKQWQRVVSELGDRHCDVVPVGWLTIQGVAEVLNLSESAARKSVVVALKRKTVESRKFKIRCGDVIRNVNHYKPRL
jgi:hypothetical protein